MALALAAAAGWATPSDAATLTAHPHPQIHVGGFPTGMSIDPATDTVYVGNGTDDNLSLINGQTCNSAKSTGCGQKVVAVTAGTDPIGSIVDTTTNTVYAINASSDSVAVINGRSCDAQNTTGCSATPAVIHVGSGPEFGALDPATHTLYVANFDGNSISVINVRSCNSTVVTGCANAVVATVPSSHDPFAVAVDVPTDTVYVTNDGSNTVTVINGRTCNATVHSGCSGTHRLEYVGQSPGGIAVDQSTNTVYVADQSSSDVAMFFGGTCDSINVSRCGTDAYRFMKGNGDRGVAIDNLTDSIYVANTDGNTVLVLNGHGCNGTVHTGCSHYGIAHVGQSPRRVVVDEPSDTIYVSNAGSNTVSMINGKSCNGTVIGGC